MLGAFTAGVMMSNIAALDRSERGSRLVMASLALGGSIWAMHFVGLLSLNAPINFAHNPLILVASAAVAFLGAAAALFSAEPSEDRVARMPLAIVLFGLAIAATHYLGIAAIAGRGLHLSWFLTLIAIAVAFEAGALVLWFLFRPRGVIVTLLGAIALGVCLSGTHYMAIASTRGLDQTLLAVPPYSSSVPGRYLAWSATIVMYLLCSICLCIFVVTQFRDQAE